MLDATKDAHGAGITWISHFQAGVEVLRRFHLDLTCMTHQGVFSLWADVKSDGEFQQYRLMTLHPSHGGHLLLARLCRCVAHRHDEHPVHWHELEDLTGTAKRPPRPVLSLTPEMLSEEAVQEEFVSTMRITNLQGGLGA